jgi:hypothetical protein
MAAAADKLAARCGCCGRPEERAGEFGCYCTTEIFCRRCNRCSGHCHCGAAAEMDLPLCEQLALAKIELAAMGVRL